MRERDFFKKENIPPDQNKGKDLTPLKPDILGKKIAKGSHSSVYEINKPTKNFGILKIGETVGYAPPLLKMLKISFSREKSSRFLEKILGSEFKISPDIDFIKNGVAEYLLMKEYFGSRSQEGLGSEGEERRKELISALQDRSHSFYAEMEKVLGEENLIKEVAAVVQKHEQDVFLPKEQTVIGHPPELKQDQAEDLLASGQKLPATYYIFQESVKGKNIVPLLDLSEKELSERPELLEKLLMFAVLTKKMYSDTGKLIDTRPEEIAKAPFEWFQSTANILVDKGKESDGGVFFVDTRWFYERDSRLGRGGINLIEHLGARSVDRAIRKYAVLLQASKNHK